MDRMDRVDPERPIQKVNLAAAGVSVSEEFARAVGERLPPAVRLILWWLRELTGLADPAAAAECVATSVDNAIAAELLQRQPVLRDCLLRHHPGEVRTLVLEVFLGPRDRAGIAETGPAGRDFGLARNAGPAVEAGQGMVFTDPGPPV
jgi:hypothetical protein